MVSRGASLGPGRKRLPPQDAGPHPCRRGPGAPCSAPALPHLLHRPASTVSTGPQSGRLGLAVPAPGVKTEGKCMKLLESGCWEINLSAAASLPLPRAAVEEVHGRPLACPDGGSEQGDEGLAELAHGECAR